MKLVPVADHLSPYRPSVACAAMRMFKGCPLTGIREEYGKLVLTFRVEDLPKPMEVTIGIHEGKLDVRLPKWLRCDQGGSDE